MLRGPLPDGVAILNALHQAFWVKVDLQYQPRDPQVHRTWLLELAYSIACGWGMAVWRRLPT